MEADEVAARVKGIDAQVDAIRFLIEEEILPALRRATRLPFACDGCSGLGRHWVARTPFPAEWVDCRACGGTGRRDGLPTSDEFVEIGLRAAAAGREPVVYPIPPEVCSLRWKTGDHNCKTYDHVCIRQPGHDGPHHSQLGADL